MGKCIKNEVFYRGIENGKNNSSNEMAAFPSFKLPDE
jgi:hypothetical protein